MEDGLGNEGNHFHFDEVRHAWELVTNSDEEIGWFVSLFLFFSFFAFPSRSLQE